MIWNGPFHGILTTLHISRGFWGFWIRNSFKNYFNEDHQRDYDLPLDFTSDYFLNFSPSDSLWPMEQFQGPLGSLQLLENVVWLHYCCRRWWLSPKLLSTSFPSCYLLAARFKPIGHVILLILRCVRVRMKIRLCKGQRGDQLESFENNFSWISWVGGDYNGSGVQIRFARHLRFFSGRADLSKHLYSFKTKGPDLWRSL